MTRILISIAIVVALLLGWRAAFLVSPFHMHPAAPPVQTVVETVNQNIFEGTLTYGKDNIGLSVPYILFRNARGAIETKALIFTTGSKCETNQGTYPCSLIEGSLPFYVGGAPVTLTGSVHAEQLIVSHLALSQSY